MGIILLVEHFQSGDGLLHPLDGLLEVLYFQVLEMELTKVAFLLGSHSQTIRLFDILYGGVGVPHWLEAVDKFGQGYSESLGAF